MPRRILLSITAALCAVAWTSPAAGQTVTRGPYLQNATPTSLVVRWRTDANTDSRVLYGLSPSDLSSEVVDGAMTNEHVVELTGLSPETTYYYAIGTTSNILAGGDSDHHFDTLPVGGTERPVRVWVIGDSGTANDNARRVRDAYLDFNGEGAYTEAWLMLGDNAYSDGTDAEYQAAVFDMYPMLLRQTPLWPTLGNHDGHTADSGTQTGPYYDIFTLPKSGEAGGLASGTEAYYSFDYANVHFICLDSYDSPLSAGGDMLTWLENDLADTTQKWIVAYWHHPPYSKGSHDSDGGTMKNIREAFVPILEQYGVDLVLSGHSHGYERSFQIDGHYGLSGSFDETQHLIDGGDGREGGDGAYFKDLARARGAVYIVAGSSGKVSAGPMNHPVMYLSLLQLGSLVLDFNGDRLDVNFIDDAGMVRDYLTILKAHSLYVLDGYGGMHASGAAGDMSPATPYFGWDIARDLELASTGFYLLDGYGGVHAGGGAPVMSPASTYFGWDIARDLELASTGFYVLDGFGGVHDGGGASTMSGTPYFGFDIGRDLELAATGFYVLDGYGGVHAGGGAPSMSPATPYFGFDIAKDLELAATGSYVLDGYGGVHAGGGASSMSPATPYFGFNIARDLELAASGFYVLDGLGGVHAGGGASPMSPATTYFGFDIACDLEHR